jgi:transposase
MGKQSKYDEAFKQNAVGLVMSGHKTSQVARDLGLNPETLYQWVRKHRESLEKTPFSGERLTSNRLSSKAGVKSEPSEDARELARLRKENELLKMERDILKKAVGIFSLPPR